MATRGVNDVSIMGHIGNDPDIRYMPNGDLVANISIATSEVWKDKESGEQREETEWHRIVAFRGLAKVIGDYCRKGHKLYVQGRLKTRKWTDKDGITRYTTEIIAHDVQLVESRNSGSYPPPQGAKQPPAQQNNNGQPPQAGGTVATVSADNRSASPVAHHTSPANQAMAADSGAQDGVTAMPQSEMDEQPPLHSEPPPYDGLDDDIPF